MRARFYSPEIKRFVNQDILLGKVADGQTLNRYAFVTGQPVNYVDPFGLAKYCGQCGTGDKKAYNCLIYNHNLCEPGTVPPKDRRITCRYSISEHTLRCLSSGNTYIVATEGIFSGYGGCLDDPGCVNFKDKGPIPPGSYNISPNDLHEGWWAIQSQYWIPYLSGLLCRAGYTRCGYNLHIGTVSLGCITFSSHNQETVQVFELISQLLRNSNNPTLIVEP